MGKLPRDEPPDLPWPGSAALINAESAWDIHVSGDSAYLASAGGLVRIDGDRLTLDPRGEDGPAPRTGLTCSLVDVNGTLWVGTSYLGLWSLEEGGWRERSKRSGTFPSDSVYSIVEWQGAIWAGTGDGLVRLSGDQSELFKGPDLGVGDSSLVLSLAASHSALWIGALQGVARWTDGGPEPVELPDNSLVSAVDVDAAGDAWASASTGLHRIRAGELVESYSPDDWGGVAGWAAGAEVVGESVFVIVRDDVNLYEMRGEEAIVHHPSDGAPVALDQDASGRLWVASAPLDSYGTETHCNATTIGGGAVSRYDGRSWKSVATDLGMPRGLITVLAELESGVVVTGGSLGWSRGSFADLERDADSESLLRNFTSLLEMPDGSLLAGSFCTGLLRHDDNRWSAIEDHGLPTNSIGGLSVNALAQSSSGEVWAGLSDPIYFTLGLLARFDGTSWHAADEEAGYPDPYAEIFTVLVDAGGNLWVGGNFFGLWKRTASGAWSALDGGNSPLPATTVVRTLAEDDAGRLWLGTDTGLMLFDPSSGELVEHFTRQAHGLPSNHVHAIELAADGKVWIGTGVESADEPFSTGGVGMFDGSSWTVFHRGNSSLPINSVFSLLADGEANLWAGSFDSIVPLIQR